MPGTRQKELWTQPRDPDRLVAPAEFYKPISNVQKVAKERGADVEQPPAERLHVAELRTLDG